MSSYFINTLAANQFYQATRMDPDDFLSTTGSVSAGANTRGHDFIGRVPAPPFSPADVISADGGVTIGQSVDAGHHHHHHQHHTQQNTGAHEFNKYGTYGCSSSNTSSLAGVNPFHGGIPTSSSASSSKTTYYDYDDVIKDYRYAKYPGTYSYPGTQFLTDAHDPLAAVGGRAKHLDYAPRAAFATASLLHGWTTLPGVARVKGYPTDVIGHKTTAGWNSTVHGSGTQGLPWMNLTSSPQDGKSHPHIQSTVS